MEQYDLPEGWVWTTLGEICEPITQVNPGNTPDEMFKYIDISSIDSRRNQIVEHKEVLGSDAPSRARKPVNARDILFSTVRTYLRNVAMVPLEFDGEIASTGFCVLRTYDEIDPRFVFYHLLTDEFIQRISEKQRGISYPAVTDRDVYAESIPLAPLPEQLRIAEKIEALFEQSRTTREALDEIPALLRKFRQSVLAAAFRGDLTTRDPDDEPASVLLERILDERRRRWGDDLRAKGKDPRRYTYQEPTSPDTSNLPELPEGWVWASFEELLIELKNGYFSGAPALEGQGIPILRISAVRPLSVSFQDLRYLERETIEDVSDYLLRDGDLLFTRYNGSLNLVGVCGMVRGVASLIVYPDKLIRARVSEGILPEYLEFHFGARVARDVIEEKAKSSAGQQGISGRDLKSVPVAVAPLEEQRRIVSHVQSLFTQADIVEVAAEISRQRLDRLDQSILARAFRGEFVPQYPDDEPASVLLARIQEERKERKSQVQKRVRKVSRQQEGRRIMPVNFPGELTDLLKEMQHQADEPVSPKDLWLASGLTIDDFYAFLKHEVREKRIREIREKPQDEKSVFLEVRS